MVESAWTIIWAGVPQGSILGPLLFLLFINDIVTDIGSNIRLFADDTSLFIIVENPDMATELLNMDLEKTMEWAEHWLVTFQQKQNLFLSQIKSINLFIHLSLWIIKSSKKSRLISILAFSFQMTVHGINILISLRKKHGLKLT